MIFCSLAKKLYSRYFTQVELGDLRRQLQLFEFDVLCNSKFQNMSSLSKSCKRFVETRKGSIYFLINLVCLVLTFLVSTTTTERSFSTIYETYKK
jgi:hypothetical protein